MNVTKKLEIFSNVSIREAKRKNKEVRNEIENKFKKACDEYRKEAERAAENIIVKETYKAEQTKNKDITEAMKSERKALIELRNELTEKIFDNVQDSIDKFINSEMYEDYLTNQIKHIKELYASDAKIIIMKKDEKYKNSLANMEIEFTSDDFIGGYKVIIKNKNMVIDDTIKSRLIEAKNSFNVFKIIN